MLFKALKLALDISVVVISIPLGIVMGVGGLMAHLYDSVGGGYDGNEK